MMFFKLFWPNKGKLLTIHMHQLSLIKNNQSSVERCIILAPVLPMPFCCAVDLSQEKLVTHMGHRPPCFWIPMNCSQWRTLKDLGKGDRHKLGGTIGRRRGGVLLKHRTMHRTVFLGPPPKKEFSSP